MANNNRDKNDDITAAMTATAARKRQTHQANNNSAPLSDRDWMPDVLSEPSVFDSPEAEEPDDPCLELLDRKRVKRQRRVVVAGAPAKPTNFTAKAVSSTQIDLTWDEPASANTSFLTYTVDRRVPSGHGSYKWLSQVKELTSNVFIDINAHYNFTYQYRVYATDENGRDGHYSKIAAATAFASLSEDPIKRLWLRVRAEINKRGLNLELLCMDKALLASRKHDKDRDEAENRAIGVFVLTKQATEEKIIGDSAKEHEPRQVVKEYLGLRNLSKCDQKNNHESALAELRPQALDAALAAYALAGADLLTKYAGYVYSTAVDKLADEIQRDRSIHNLCEHNSKEDRAKRAAKRQWDIPLTTRVHADAAFGGSVLSLPVFAEISAETDGYATGNEFYVRVLTAEEKAARSKFLKESHLKERSTAKLLHENFDTYGHEDRDQEDDPDSSRRQSAGTYTPANTITPDIAESLTPTVIRSLEDLDNALENEAVCDIEATLAVIDATSSNNIKAFVDKRFVKEMTLPELAEEYEGSSDKAAIQRIARLEKRTLADIKEKLISYKPPGMTANLLQDAFIELHHKENEATQ
jgi:fibronectin type 3 domain-containing protein